MGGGDNEDRTGTVCHLLGHRVGQQECSVFSPWSSPDTAGGDDGAAPNGAQPHTPVLVL